MTDVKKLRIYTQIHTIITSGFTVKNTLKEMVPVWEELKSADGSCIITTDHASRKKYQLVQLYARKLMKYFSSINGMDMFPMTLEDPEVGNWRIDSIILQIASNEIKGHEHMFKLMMTNLFGVPTIMFELIDGGFKCAKLNEMIQKTYPLDNFSGLDMYAADEEITVEYLDEMIDNLVMLSSPSNTPFGMCAKH